MAYKVCPACAEEVQARAKKCKHCGENLSEVASRRSLGEVLGIGCAALFALSAFVTCFADPQPHRRAAPTSTSSSAPAEDLSRVREEAAERAAEAAAQRERDAAEARPKLKVLSYQWGREYGYITLEGEVKNLSDEPLDGLQADDFDAVFIPGGHGTMFDFPGNLDIGRLLAKFHDAGKSIASVRAAPESPVELLALNRDDFQKLIAESPLTAESLGRIVQNRLQENKSVDRRGGLRLWPFK